MEAQSPFLRGSDETPMRLHCPWAAVTLYGDTETLAQNPSVRYLIHRNLQLFESKGKYRRHMPTSLKAGHVRCVLGTASAGCTWSASDLPARRAGEPVLRSCSLRDNATHRSMRAHGCFYCTAFRDCSRLQPLNPPSDQAFSANSRSQVPLDWRLP